MKNNHKSSNNRFFLISLKKIQRSFAIPYLTIFFVFTTIYILSFRSSLFINQSVLFYRGLLLLIVTSILTFISSLLLNRYVFKTRLETIIAAFAIMFSFNLTFFVIFPVTFDRSVTMYLLATLKGKPTSNICGGLTKQAIEQYFINEYVVWNKAIDRRIQEQSIINFIKEEKNCVKLTQKGNNFLNFSELIKKIYSIK